MTVEQRLECLERQNRRIRMGIALFVAVIAAGFMIGQVKQDDDVAELIRARAFHVVSEDGEPLVKIEDTHGHNRGAGGTITTLSGEGGETHRTRWDQERGSNRNPERHGMDDCRTRWHQKGGGCNPNLGLDGWSR